MQIAIKHSPLRVIPLRNIGVFVQKIRYCTANLLHLLRKFLHDAQAALISLKAGSQVNIEADIFLENMTAQRETKIIQLGDQQVVVAGTS